MDTIQKKTSKKPRKIMKVYPTEYEGTKVINSNKKYWINVFREKDDPKKAMINESMQLADILPSQVYKEVCAILQLPIASPIKTESKEIKGQLPRRSIKEPMLSHRKHITIDRELDSDTDVEIYRSDDDDSLNVHRTLLKKPEREQITWATHYLEPEREDEKTLVKKAADLTDRIANEFCGYMKQLGGDQQSQLFTPKAIKELFQIEFDTHVSRGLRVITKELPTIAEKIAKVTNNPEKSHYAALEREISKDIKAECRLNRQTAFGQSLPLRKQFLAPNNDTKKLWRSERHVPNDLVTLKTVWEGITNLRSVKEYCRWMIKHPEYRRPSYLNSLGMFDPGVLKTRLTLEMEQSIIPISNVPASEPKGSIRNKIPLE